MVFACKENSWAMINSYRERNAIELRPTCFYSVGYAIVQYPVRYHCLLIAPLHRIVGQKLQQRFLVSVLGLCAFIKYTLFIFSDRRHIPVRYNIVGLSEKLLSRYTEPQKVLRQLSDVNYEMRHWTVLHHLPYLATSCTYPGSKRTLAPPCDWASNS